MERPKLQCVICRNADTSSTVPVCYDCWVQLSPGERLSAWQAANQSDQLRQILIRMEHLPDGACEVAQLAKSIEQLTRIVKLPMDELDAIIGDLGKLVKFIGRKMQEEDDGGEPWRESLRPDNDG